MKETIKNEIRLAKKNKVKELMMQMQYDTLCLLEHDLIQKKPTNFDVILRHIQQKVQSATKTAVINKHMKSLKRVGMALIPQVLEWKIDLVRNNPLFRTNEKEVIAGLLSLEYPQAYLEVHKYYMSQGNFEKSHETLQNGITKFPLHRDLAVGFALSSLQRYRLQEAYQITNALLEVYDNDKKLLLLLAGIYTEMYGKPIGQVEHIFNEIPVKSQRNLYTQFYSRYIFAKCCLGIADYRDVIQEIRTLIQGSPSCVKSEIILAQMYIDDDKYHEAREILTKEKIHNHPEAKVQNLRLQLYEHKYNEVLSIIDDDNISFLREHDRNVLRSEMYLMEGKKRQAILELQNGMKLIEEDTLEFKILKKKKEKLEKEDSIIESIDPQMLSHTEIEGLMIDDDEYDEDDNY